jgi:predicted nucleotidyltransferase
VRVLTSRHPEIEKVILFGSLARGDAVPGSDADLLLILRECDLPFEERGTRYQISGVGIGVDLFAYTMAELDRMREEGNPFLSQALSESVVLT